MIENKKWIQIRKELFQQIRDEVFARLGSEDSELRRYRANYEKEFCRDWTPLINSKMIQLVEGAPLVFYGDFHAHQQSQKTILRILRGLNKKSDFKQRILCLECFESQHQKLLDSFISSEISEKQFLKQINWESRWGFPWEYYKGLIHWARRNNFKIIALNKISLKKNITLKKRDLHSAQILARLRKKFPEAQIHVVYGELHLSKNHLLKSFAELRKKMKFQDQPPLRIFQNSEKIYFEILNKKMESTLDAVTLGNNEICILNVPPWVKWHSYLVFLDNSLIDLDFDDDEDDDDDAIDYTDFVSKYVQLINEELGLKVSLSNLSVYTASDENLWKTFAAHFSKSELKTLEYFVEERISFYLPKLNIAYLARNSINHMSSLAMQYVHAHLSAPARSFIQMPDDFLKLIWMENIAYFGSKLVNPKRKSDTVFDLKVSLTSPTTERRLRDAYRLSVEHKMKEFKAISLGVKMSTLKKYNDHGVYLKSAFLLGDMLGEKLFYGYREGLISSATIVRLMNKSLASKNFTDVYLEMIEIVESLPQPFKSKFDKI